VAERCREPRGQRVSTLEHWGDDAVEGIDKRVRQGQRSAREGLGVRVLGLDASAQPTGHRDVVGGLSDIARGQVSAVVNSRPQAALEASCDGLRPAPRAAIAVVSLDLWAASADVARTKGPQAAMVVDRFPVRKTLQEKRPDARRAAQRQLPNTTRDALKGRRWRLVRHDAELDAEARQQRPRAVEMGPELATRHSLKEAFRAFDEPTHRRTAIRALETWIAKVQQTGHKARLKCAETGRRWEQESLTDCDERITTGFVEGTTNTIKLSKRRAFGFRNCENLRDRLLHECGGL